MTDSAPRAGPDGESSGSEGAGEGREPWIPWLFTGAALLLALAFYRDFVLHPGRMLFGTDIMDQAYQLREFGLSEVKAGRGIPLWNPFVYGGLPYLAILPGPVFYPTSLLYLAMPLFRAIGWTFVLHTFLAGAIGYYAARVFRLSRGAAAVTGLSFMFTGYVVSLLYGGHDGRMFAMILFPLVLAFMERGIRSERLRWFGAAGMVVGLQILTPHAQVMYYSSLVVAAYVGYRLWRLYSGGRGVGSLLKPAGYVAAAFVLGAMVGAVQILPTLGMMEHGVRGGGVGGYAFAASWALPPQELTAFVLPDLVGSLQSYWGANPFKLHTEYLGAVPLALATVAVAARYRRPRIWFLAGVSVLGVLFALGDATPVHRIAYELVPLVDRFRAPAMMLGPVSFLVALLAGIGWDVVLEARRTAGSREGGENRDAGKSREAGEEGAGERIPWIWIWALSAPVLLLGLAALLAPGSLQDWVYHAWYPQGWERRPPEGSAGALQVNGALLLVGWAGSLGAGWAVATRRQGRWLLLLPLLVLVVELWRVDARYLQTVDPDRHFAADELVTRMQEELGPGERALPVERSYGPNELMFWDVPAVTGSQNFRLEWYDRLVGGVSYDNLLQRPVLWELLDVGFVTTRSPVEAPMLEPAGQGDRARLYRVARDAPHAYFPREIRVAEDSAAALRQTLQLQGHASAAIVGGKGETPASGQGTARVELLEPDRMELAVEAREGGLLVVSEVFHPSWHAYLDGREVEIHRVNVALRGVEVPAGSHRLEFRYESGSYRAGLAASALGAGLGLAGLLAWLVAGLRRRFGSS